MIALSTLPSEQKAAWFKFIGKIKPTGNKNDVSQFVIDSHVNSSTGGSW
jgi:hypothetical protein